MVARPRSRSAAPARRAAPSPAAAARPAFVNPYRPPAGFKDLAADIDRVDFAARQLRLGAGDVLDLGRQRHLIPRDRDGAALWTEIVIQGTALRGQICAARHAHAVALVAGEIEAGLIARAGAAHRLVAELLHPDDLEFAINMFMSGKWSRSVFPELVRGVVTAGTARPTRR